MEQVEAREWSFVEDFFTQSEAEYTKQLEGETRHLWSTLVWSAKEAVLKALGTGWAFGTLNALQTLRASLGTGVEPD